MNLSNYANLLARPSLLDEINSELAARCLGEFVRQAWEVVEPATPFVAGWHIDAIIEHLDAVSRGQIRRLIINIPPRHMKSLLVSVFWPAWEWIQWPERRWLFSSYGAQLSLRDSLKCRRLIESPWYQRHWRGRFRLTTDQNTKSRFENDKTGLRLATSVGGAATGEGGDRTVCDDPHNVQEAESEAIRKSTIDWWDTVMSTRVNDPRTAALVVVMQRCHAEDLSGHLLEQGGWDHLCLPAEYERIERRTSLGWMDPRRQQGELLWPERFGRTEIDTLKRSLGSYAAAAQLQQRPSPAEGGLLKRHWWRFWKPRDVSVPSMTIRSSDGSLQTAMTVDIPEYCDEQLQSWDCAFKDLDTSDYVVGQVWCRAGGDYFLLDQRRDKMDCPATVRAVRELTRDWPRAMAKLIEDKANGSAVIQMLQHELPGLIPVNPEGGKAARASAVSPIVESGNVYLPHPSIAPWVDDFIEECASFPNGRHDDQVDAATQALLRLAVGREEETVIVYDDFVEISPY